MCGVRTGNGRRCGANGDFLVGEMGEFGGGAYTYCLLTWVRMCEDLRRKGGGDYGVEG